MLNKCCGLLLSIGLLSQTACKKEQVSIDDCLNNATTTRQIFNRLAVVTESSTGVFYLVELSSIDTKLRPCNLPAEYQVNNLQVTISGDVKATAENNPVPPPCCLEDFVITAISR